MSHRITVPLAATPDQFARLKALQARFVAACNQITPVVQQARCWNRVALHHLVYKDLRLRFPELGSQMVCNAIYSVCRAARLIYQGDMAARLAAAAGQEVPLFQFLDNAPVYFDRHTLSIKKGVLSLFTLDGRMKVLVDLPQAIERHFQEYRLREIVLTLESQACLHFTFGDEADVAPQLRDLPGHLLVLSDVEACGAARANSAPDRVRNIV